MIAEIRRGTDLFFFLFFKFCLNTVDNNENSWAHTRGHIRLKEGKGSSFSRFPSFLLRNTVECPWRKDICGWRAVDGLSWMDRCRRDVSRRGGLLQWCSFTTLTCYSEHTSALTHTQRHKWQSYSTRTMSPTSTNQISSKRRQQPTMQWGCWKLLGSLDVHPSALGIPFRHKGSGQMLNLA